MTGWGMSWEKQRGAARKGGEDHLAHGQLWPTS